MKSTSGPSVASNTEAMSTLSEYLELALDKGRHLIMVRSRGETSTLYLRDTGSAEDELTECGAIRNELANAILESTPSGLAFVSSSQATWAAANHVDKATRQATDAARRQVRGDTMWAASRGACLTWSDDAGWHVIDAIAPANGDLRRRRLLGLPAGRPWCWLYRAADGRFVARVEGARLQVLAATPAAAIMALRRCATDYRRVCQVALPPATSVPLVVPEPLAARSAADYRFFVACVRGERGFWDDASKLAEAARCYRRAQAQVVRAEP